MELKQIKELIKILDASKVNTLKLKNGDFSIHLSKNTNQAKSIVQQAITETIPSSTISQNEQKTIEPSVSTNSDHTINSPMVGTFYSAMSPKSPPLVKVGDTLSKGDKIGIIEAMKIMNEIEADFDCKILEILAKNEQPVEFDMPLFRVEKI